MSEYSADVRAKVTPEQQLQDAVAGAGVSHEHDHHVSLLGSANAAHGKGSADFSGG